MTQLAPTPGNRLVMKIFLNSIIHVPFVPSDVLLDLCFDLPALEMISLDF